MFDNRKVRQVHAGLDVLVVPSVWYENSPTVILEAYAAGTPVLVSDLGGMAELVQDGVSGFTFSTGNAAALAGLLQRLMDHREDLEALRAACPPSKPWNKKWRELVGVYRQVARPGDARNTRASRDGGTLAAGRAIAPLCWPRVRAANERHRGGHRQPPARRRRPTARRCWPP